MASVIFRNRLDPNNPAYAKPGKGALGHAGTVSALSIGGGGPLSISSISGTLTHGASVTVNGSGFGARTGVTQVWDNCEGTNPLDLWTQVQPVGQGGLLDLTYRTPAALGRGVALPHSRGTKYICGCHRTTANEFNQVWLVHQVTTPPYPYYSRWVYYYRVDPNWQSCGVAACDPSDNNFKVFVAGYNLLTQCFMYINPDPNEFLGAGSTGVQHNLHDVDLDPPEDVLGWQVGNDSGGSVIVGTPHSTIDNSVYSNAIINPATAWVKVEQEIRWDRNVTGYIKMWENSTLILHATGPTDTNTNAAFPTRQESWQAYARARHADNYRYGKDIYHAIGQHALARVELASGSTYATRGVTEPQPISSWGSGAIGITLNLGAITAGTRYFYVTDNAGNTSSGFPVTVT